MVTTAAKAVGAQAGAIVLAAACFAAGLTAAALLPTGSSAVTPAAQAAAQSAAAAPRTGYPAEVLRVIDGDTFEARVRVWPGMDVTTRVRLRGVDAAEMHARCDAERSKAVAAREALSRLLAEGSVGVTAVGQDKYGGRVDAQVSTARTPDVGAAMIAAGQARPYDGGRRNGWCG